MNPQYAFIREFIIWYVGWGTREGETETNQNIYAKEKIWGYEEEEKLHEHLGRGLVAFRMLLTHQSQQPRPVGLIVQGAKGCSSEISVVIFESDGCSHKMASMEAWPIRHVVHFSESKIVWYTPATLSDNYTKPELFSRTQVGWT